MTTLINTYHGTTYKTRKSASEINKIEEKWYCRYHTLTAAEKQFIQRSRRALCGMSDCGCGDFIGRRNQCP